MDIMLLFSSFESNPSMLIEKATNLGSFGIRSEKNMNAILAKAVAIHYVERKLSYLIVTI